MRPIFLAALVYVLLWRVAELVLSRRNARRVLAAGGRRVRPDGMGGIVLVHAGWILALLVEELRGAPVLGSEELRLAGGVAFAVGEVLRAWCIWTLGERWNVHVVVSPGVPPVARGPYRWLQHPNYAAVVLTLAALPVALGFPWIAAVAVPLKLLALRPRLRVEEAALLAG